MKKVSVVGRWPLGRWAGSASDSRRKCQALRVLLAAGLACALWCGGAKPAQAEWQMRYEWQGTTTISDWPPFDWLPSSPQTQDLGGHMTPAEIDGGVFVFDFGNNRSELSGTFCAVFTWRGEDPVPEKLWVKVTTEAVAVADSDVPPETSDGPQWTYELETEARSSLGTNRNLSQSGEGWEWKRAGGVKLIQKDTDGQREVRVEADMTAASSVDITPQRYSGNGYTWQSLSFRAEATSRGVAISSSIDQSFRKSTSNPPVKEPVPNGEPVHSAAFWEEVGDAGWRGAATYHANTLGFNNPTYLWRLTGGTPGIGTLFDVPNGPRSIFDAIDLGGSQSGEGMTTESTIQVFVQDQDGTTDENEYTVNWHLPYEKERDLPNFPVTTHARGGAVSEEATGEITVPLGVSVPSGEVPVKYFLDALGAVSGVAAQIIKETDNIINDPYRYNEQNFTVSGRDAWERAKALDQGLDPNNTSPQSDRIPAGLAETPNGWAYCTFQYYLVTYTRSKRWYADHYTEHGFDSSGHTLGSDEVTLVQAEPWFTQQRMPNDAGP